MSNKEYKQAMEDLEKELEFKCRILKRGSIQNRRTLEAEIYSTIVQMVQISLENAGLRLSEDPKEMADRIFNGLDLREE